MMLGLLNMGRPARAQDEADPDEEQPVQQRRGLFATDAQFDQWFDQMAFGQTGGIDQTRKLFESRLSAKIGELDEMYRFTPDQKKKLELAGKRDIYRFFETTRENKEMLNRARNDRMQFLAILQDRQALQMRIQRNDEAPFGEGSLFAKTLKTTLACEQFAERSRDVFRARVSNQSSPPWTSDSG